MDNPFKGMGGGKEGIVHYVTVVRPKLNYLKFVLKQQRTHYLDYFHRQMQVIQQRILRGINQQLEYFLVKTLFAPLS